MKITAVNQIDKVLLDGVNALLSQLTATFTPLTARQLRRVVASACCRLYVATEGSDTLGMLTLVIFPIPTGMRSWIEDLVVDETARGKGIAQKLLRRALAHAKTRGADNVNLSAHAGRKAAHELYGKMGFERRETNVYRHRPGGGQ